MTVELLSPHFWALYARETRQGYYCREYTGRQLRRCTRCGEIRPDGELETFNCPGRTDTEDCDESD